MMLLFLLVALAHMKNGASNLIPRSVKQALLSSACSSSKLLLPVVTAVSSLHTAKAVAADYKGKLEYQPALQGLDYGMFCSIQ